jgi:DNA-3-methyladenine glycosylase
MKALPPDFYDRPVLEVARELIGCTVEHRGAAGVIVETEAYHESEPACHAFVGLTPRTRTLFGEPGRAYVYRSYGIHALLNAVCEPEGVGAAVLIRALAPIAGLEVMRARRWPTSRSDPVLPTVCPAAADRLLADRPTDRRSAREHDLCSGPGKLTQALGISLSENDSDLSNGPVRIGPRRDGWLEPPVLEGTRIGITRAVDLRWRFCAAGNRHVSRPRPQEAAA